MEKGENMEILMKASEVMKALGISRSTLWRMTQEKRINPVYIGPKMPRYKRSEIIAIQQGER